ncbi:hypothetical protein RhiJN_18542 [Ceratobasidium sp. AG-Ba]|nr:hypothetical protein RhiJN_18542 [Ceratobasidium sp. AG-Ba]
MASFSEIQFSSFASLPYHIQEHIVDLIDHYATYLALAVASKYLSELCVRSLYQTVEFGQSDSEKQCWPGIRGATKPRHIRFPQNTYSQTLTSKPELAIFTQHISWDISDDWSWHLATGLSISQLWSTFEHLSVVRTLNLRVNVSSQTLRPPNPLFPQLVRARVQGTFPQHALEQFLLTSPYIRHLAIAPSTREYLHHPGEPYAYGTSIEPFLRTCVSKNAFRYLRTLEIGLDSNTDPELATQFIEMSAEWITELRIEYDFGDSLRAFEKRVVPMLKSRRWRNLIKLELPKIAIPKEPIPLVRAYCPTLISIGTGSCI